MKVNSLLDPAGPHVFRPLTQSYDGYATLVVRTAGAPLALAPAVRSVVAALDPAMTSDVRTFAQLMAGRALILPRLAASLAGAFGVLALLLAIVGLYGVVSYGVSQRAREFGIRVALGAERANLLGMVLRDGLARAGLGVGIGTLLAAGATRAMRSLLYGVGAADPLTFAGVVVSLLGVTLVAQALPAARAMRVDPVVALRQD
jgi:ABC-type antimicrobial peptide transport system permease subunit